jgi:hypothetical protein
MLGYKRKRADSLKKPFIEEYGGIQLNIGDSDRIMGFRINLVHRGTKPPICRINQGISLRLTTKPHLAPVHQQKAL